MRRSKVRSFRLNADEVPPALPITRRADFYLEEFLKHQWCLEHQREYFSERAYSDVECALRRIIAELDRLCGSDDADCLVATLLRKFDVVTGLSARRDPKTLH